MMSDDKGPRDIGRRGIHDPVRGISVLSLPWNTINRYSLLGVIWSLFAKFPRFVDQKLQLGQIPVCLNIDKNNSFGLYEVIFSHYWPRCTCEIAHMAFRKADLVIVTPIHIDTREVNQNVIR